MVVKDGSKRQKVSESSSKGFSFKRGQDVHDIFVSRDNNVDALKALRNQLTIRSGEGQLAVDDERLLLIRQWYVLAPGGWDILALLEGNTHASLLPQCVSVLSCLVSLSSYHFVDHVIGQAIIHNILSSKCLRRLEGFLSGSNTDLVLVTLKLLNSISAFAGGREQKALQEALLWDIKVFHKLLYMRRKGKGATGEDVLDRPDIRTLAMLFILSFISYESSSFLKNAVLEQRRDFFLSVFKGLSSDPYPVVRYTLEAIWSNMWQDSKVKRTLKVGLFGEATIQHLVKLYDRSNQEGVGADQIPANLVHHFLLAICTHRGIGVCFADSGWYPRSTDGEQAIDREERPHHHKGGRVYNRILANVLKMLKVNDDARQQELALKILQACPELVSGYLASSGITLEPRLSSKWLVNVAFLGSVISLPIPFDSFFMPIGVDVASSSSTIRGQFRPSPPPLSAIVENILPSMSLKIHFSKGLQSTSFLVQHTTAVVLAKCLLKCVDVLDALKKVEKALEEDAVSGQWAKRRLEVETEVRKRVPDFQVIIVFSQHKGLIDTPGAPNASATKVSLLGEVAQRILWLYHRCVPSLVAEVKYEVGKSLQNLVRQEGKIELAAEETGLGCLEQLHVLQMLRESSQFSWSAKPGPNAPSNIHILLTLFVRTQESAIKDALTSLLEHTFDTSLLFQHNASELQLWLDALPTSVRAAETESPDGALLTDERNCVVTFLDDCLQRCTKNAYRYIEDLVALLGSSSQEGSDDVEMKESGDSHPSSKASTQGTATSPLIMTVLEQLAAKTKNDTVSPSDNLALVTYIRKLTTKQIGIHQNLDLPKAVLKQLVRIFDEQHFSSYPVMKAAIQREIHALKDCIQTRVVSAPLQGTHPAMQLASPAVQEFLEQIENLPIPDSFSQRMASAYELIDWLRLIDQTLGITETARLVNAVHARHPPALRQLFEHLPIRSHLLWSQAIETELDVVLAWLSFDWLLLQTAAPDFLSSSHAAILVQCLRTHKHGLSSYKRYLGCLFLQLASTSNTDMQASILSFVVSIIEAAKAELNAENLNFLKAYVILESLDVNGLMCSSDVSVPVVQALDDIVEVLLDSKNQRDRDVVSSICNHWITVIENNLSGRSNAKLSRSFTWLKFMSEDHILKLAGNCLGALTESATTNDVIGLLEQVLSVIQSIETNRTMSWLSQQLPTLLGLPHAEGGLSAALKLIIGKAIESGLPYGHEGCRELQRASSLTSLIVKAESHWSSRQNAPLHNVDMGSIIVEGTDELDDRTCSILAGLIYRSRSVHSQFWRWLGSDEHARNSEAIERPLHAFLDTCSQRAFSDFLAGDGDQLVFAIFTSLTLRIFSLTSHVESRQWSIQCVCLFLKLMTQKRRLLFDLLTTEVSRMKSSSLNDAVLLICSGLHESVRADGTKFTEAVVNHALTWCVQRLSSLSVLDEEDHLKVDRIRDLVMREKSIASSTADLAISTPIRCHLSDDKAIRMAEEVIKRTRMKPANVNRLLQSVVQHPQLHRAASPSASSREQIISLLYAMFSSHPENTCQPSHIQPLVPLYSASLSISDRRLLKIFQMFELQGKGSVGSLIASWSPSAAQPSQTYLDIVTNLDPSRMIRSCLNFPVRRHAIFSEEIGEREEDSEIYDPFFVLLLLCQCFIESPPEAALSWVQLFRTNAVSLAIRCLSAVDEALRGLAIAQLSILRKLMEDADMQEKPHVIYILDLLRNSFPSDSGISIIRLPSFTTLVLAHALRGIFYPSNFIYPLTARFLLQRSELDPHDVPMLYGMLFSSSDDWKKERAWMIRFLSDGMLSSDDWHILKRRHTWDLLASLFQRSADDRQVRLSILEVLANLTCHGQATTSLILKSSLLQWIEMQLLSFAAEESIAWTKIVENISVIVDSGKMDQATRGEWRAGLLRCLNRLLRDTDLEQLRMIARTVLRLSLVQTQRVLDTSPVVQSALGRLMDCEAALHVPLALKRVDKYHIRDNLPPHQGRRLHELRRYDTIWTWGEAVELLWSVTMSGEVGRAAWNQLSYRLILWRSINKTSSLGEWIRRECLLCLRDAGNRADSDLDEDVAAANP